MKDTTTQKLQQNCFILLEKISRNIESEQTQETIQQGNQLLCELEKNLIFYNKDARSKWLDVVQSFKSWDEFENITRKIIDNMSLVDYRNKLVNDMSGIVCDFIIDNDIESDNYIGDLFTEFADSQTSIYYDEQRKYYFEHAEQCEEDFLELYNDASVCEIIKEEGLESLIAKVGAVGEFMENERELEGSKKAIIQCLLIDYYFDNYGNECGTNSQDVIDALDNVDDYEFDTFSDYLEQFKNKIEK